MSVSEHDKKLSAALVPITSSLQDLTNQLTYLCSDLGLGMASSEQRLEVDRKCAEMTAVLERLRPELIPAVPGRIFTTNEED
jgi:hypothetical protein